MFIRGTRVKVPVDRIEALITHFKEETAPNARKVAGNRGAILLVDRKSGAGWGLTYWEDEAALTASEQAGTSLRHEAAAATGLTIDEVERLEIAVQERAAPPSIGTFVRLNDIQGDPARVEDAIRFTRETAVPSVRGLKGFRAFITGVNRQTGRGITSTAWDTLADLEASESAAIPLREQALSSTGATSVKVEVFETVFADLSLPVTT